MKEEVEKWIEQALADLDAAKKNIKIKIYYLSIQCSCQASEKALKALIIKKFNKMPEKTHDLIKLGKKVEIPEKYFEALYELNPEWIPSRYPDAATTIPAKDYDEASAKLHFKKAKEIVTWAKGQIKK
ncbi:HEPN domain-containing protein [Candidatus Woesearchaeota archaeon]|nr:HEPN domain-containing protein [Candidatus Woesearchaeota archaeon]